MLLLQLCKKLNQEKIKYALVGGYAVSLHGAIRGTLDIDIVIMLDSKSFVRTESALKDLGFESRLPVSAKQVFEFREEYIQNKNLITWSFYDPKNQSRQIDIIITEDLKKMKTTIMNIHGTKVVVASIEALIEMKSKTKRPQDIEDVKMLKEILKNES